MHALPTLVRGHPDGGQGEVSLQAPVHQHCIFLMWGPQSQNSGKCQAFRNAWPKWSQGYSRPDIGQSKRDLMTRFQTLVHKAAPNSVL